MEPGIAFSGFNSGVQIGKNYGPVNVDINKLYGLQDKIPMIESAAFDSYQDQHEATCLPGTRADILNQIEEWALSREQRCIFWLCGMAGTGKSTISRTVATSFNGKGKLGASFFFKRGEEDRGRALKLFPTIARQLSTSIPQLADHIAQAAENDPAIASKAMKEQFDKLILQPLQMVDASEASPATVVIVIDALDECDGDDDIRLILQLLPQLNRLGSLHMRLFLTSRPELAIRLGFSKLAVQDHEDLILHDIPKEVIRHDISLFLNHRLSEIKANDLVPPEWPGDTHFEMLVTLSVPLFIFAATVCRIFEDVYWDPIESLDEILAQGGNISTIDGNMGQVYLSVLDRLLRAQTQNDMQKKKLVQEFQQIVGSIVLLEGPLSIAALSSLLGLPERLIQRRLSLLHSVLHVPEKTTLPIRIFHLSFRDFLLDGETKGKTVFWVDEKLMHQTLTSRCLLACQKLERNICGLPSDAFQRIDVDRQTIDRRIPPELQYACRYWIYHLDQCERPAGMMADVLAFLQSHFLHWVEVMSILDQISESLRLLNILHEIATSSPVRVHAQVDIANIGSDSTKNENCSEMSAFLQDARRFILKNRQIADRAPLQIYCAGLVFAPRESIVRMAFSGELPRWICQLPRTEETWSAELQVLEGHSETVYSAAFSPDGRILASASRDTNVHLWDVATGALKQTLQVEEYAEWMRSISFSPDGRLLAAGSTSEKSSVRLWNTATGMCENTFKSGIGSVISLAFSPASDLLVSAGDDHSVQVWDVTLRTLQKTVDFGHGDWIRSVAFLKNGQLVSASRDKTIRVSDIATGQTIREFSGHSGAVNSIAISPDEVLLASGSDDRLIKIWDLATGSLRHSLEAHYRQINSVNFSPDSQTIASCSGDGYLRLWDTKSGSSQQILGHPDEVNSVTFSPDGKFLASSCTDHIVRIFESRTHASQGLESHSNVIHTVTLSPNGQLLASGSYDRTVRIWNANTGSLLRVLRGHADYGVISVAFSPDCHLLAAGGLDETLNIWSVATGAHLRRVLDFHSLSQIVFSPDSRLLAFAAPDYSVRLWDITGLDAPFQILHGHYKEVTSLAFSPNGKLLASSSEDEMVRLWNVATGACDGILDGHTDSVWIVAFSSDGMNLATSSYDCTVRLWSIDGMLLKTFQMTNTPSSLSFNQDASQIITNLGTLDVKSKAEDDTEKISHSIEHISIEDGQWVKLHGEKTLWLPPEARPVCCHINGNILAMGHGSGQISVIGFRV